MRIPKQFAVQEVFPTYVLKCSSVYVSDTKFTLAKTK